MSSNLEHITQKVTEIVAKKLNIEPSEVTPESDFFEDLGVDSLDVVEITLDIEKEFNIEVPESESSAIRTVQNIIDFVAAHTK